MASRDDFGTAIGQLLRERLTVPTTSLTTEDLNTLTRPGTYLCQTNANATAARNYPFPNVSGNLMVLPTNEAWTLATQIWFSNNAFGTGIATRSYRAGAWSEWVTLDPVAVSSAIESLRDGSAGALKIVPLMLTAGATPQTFQKTRGIRIPVRVNAPIGRWRIHIRNWNPRLGQVTAAPVDFTGLWVGDHNGSGGFTGTPTRVQTAFTTPADGSEWVSGWYSNKTSLLGDNVEKLIAFGFTTDTNPLGIHGGCYQFAEPERAHDETYTTATRFQVCPFEIFLEVETPTSTPVIAGIGDSLTVGTGADLPVHESWLAQYCRTVGGIPMLIAFAGDSMRGFISTNNQKWTRWGAYPRADAVVWGLGSNDLAAYTDLTVMKQDFETISTIVERDIGPIRYASTVQPRNTWDSTKETLRTEWNTWLSARPQLRGVLDFASVASADGDTLRPAYDSGDGTHLNTAGYAAEAASITVPLAGAMPASAARMTAVETALADTGTRDITALATGVSSGSIRLRVKNGWALLELSGVQLTTADATIFAGNGPLAAYAPTAPSHGRGFVTSVNTGTTYRVQVNPYGEVRLYGAPASTVLNGQAMWPMDRALPATPIGTTA